MSFDSTTDEEADKQHDQSLSDIDKGDEHLLYCDESEVQEAEDDNIEDTEIMSESKVEEQPRVDEVADMDEERGVEGANVETEEVTEITEPKTGRLRRECAGQGIKQLEMSLDNNKEYASVKSKHYNFGMSPNEHPLYRGNTSFMNVEANYLFVQVTEHAQMSAKAGIKKFGDRAVAVMLSKYRQLNAGPMPGKLVFSCIDPNDITTEERRRALEAVNLIKKKRCGKMKRRTCANGKKQKRYLKHGESILSPTVSLEAIIGTILIDVKEEGC